MDLTMNGAHAALLANAVHGQLVTGSDAVKMFVNEMLSFSTKSPAGFGGGTWSGRSSLFNFETGVFPAGFIYAIGKALKSNGVTVQFRVKEAPAPLGPKIGTVDPMGWGFAEKFDYQPQTVENLLAYKRMIAQVATGGGKSRIAILSYATIARPMMFLTTRSSLLYQMKDQFDEHGFPCGVVGDGIWEPRKGPNVAMVQTLAQMLRDGGNRRAKALNLLEHIEFLIGEEAHETAGNGYFEVANECRNAHYRLALTATPFMKGDEEDNMRLQAVFGSVGMVVSEKLLIDRGILAEPFFKYASCAKPAMLRKRDNFAKAVNVGIIEHGLRNAINVYEALRMKEIGFPVITLIQRERHGGILKEMMDAAGLRSKFLSGKSDQDQRQKGLRDLANRQLDVLIGSTIFDVGVDVPAVGMVQLAGGGKDEVALRQRIGRGLRAKKTGRNIAFIHDHNDDWNVNTREHAIIRRTLVERTPGFGERIVADGADYPL